MSKFSEANFRLLRVSKTRALQLMLLLSKQDVEWFTDVAFQQVLTMLQPLIQARVEYHAQGISSKQLQPQRSTRTGSAMVARAVAAAKASTSNSPTPSSTSAIQTPSSSSSSAAVAAGSPSGAANDEDDALDGLEDLGMVLGGEDLQQQQQQQETDSTTTNSRRRRRVGGIRASMPTPRFRVRFGFRDHMASERGAMSVLVKRKNLGFKIKSEQQNEEGKTRVLAHDGEAQGDDGVRILQEEEDEDALVRRLLHQTSRGQDDEGAREEEEGEEEGEGGPEGEAAQHRKKRARSSSDAEKSGGVDYKPTLEVAYQPLRMFPMTLYIVIRAEPEISFAEPFTATSPLPDDDDDLLPADII
ncbi:hypothetical protein DFQ26_001187 [Actinomortierella ambigua]|nr:hypothetical protein DFQ26_001187 [Actinomortierella ambigua]